MWSFQGFDVTWRTLSSILIAISIFSIVFLLTTCLHSRIYRYWMNRCRATLASHIGCLSQLCITMTGTLTFTVVQMTLYSEKMWSCQGFTASWRTPSSILIRWLYRLCITIKGILMLTVAKMTYIWRRCGSVRVSQVSWHTPSPILIRWLCRLYITINGILMFTVAKMTLYLEEMWSCQGFQLP